MDDLTRRALIAAVSLAGDLGLRCETPDILADGSNVLVHLAPAPVVARVATTTALVRKPVRQWMRIDLDMAEYLAGLQFPVVPPSRELPPGPHTHDGLTLTFWEYVEHDRNYTASAAETGRLLRELHSALRGYPGELSPLSPFAEIPRCLDEVERWKAIDDADLAMLRRGFAVVASEIDTLRLPEQPLHGDAHKKNVLKTSHGLRWTDFEDACSGPLEWDLACFVRTSGEDRSTALAAYGGDVDQDRLAPFFAARDLQGAVWGAILATRFPDRRERAAEWMAVARSRYGGLSSNC
ncbi:MAG TPA: phosphotransferase [Silvibacterium sp.]|jgi:hypothetical protein|nr:phosphotransferase [Silvibacterium sp.]